MAHTNPIRSSAKFDIFVLTAFLAVQPFQATEIVNANRFETSSGGAIPMTNDQKDFERNLDRLWEQVARLRAALILAYRQGSEGADVMRIIPKIKARGEPDLHDAWGTELRIELNPHYKTDETDGKSHILVTSAGPDRKFDTDDDLIIAFSITTGRYYLRFLNQIGRLGAALSQAYDEGAEGGDLAKIFAKMKDRGAPDVRDEWGTELHIEPSPFSSGEKIIRTYYVMRSAGPDRQWGTNDDLGIYIEARTGNLSESGPLVNTIALKVVSDRAPSKGLVEIVGNVDEDLPGYVTNASVEAVDVRSGKSLRTQTGSAGGFSLTGLPPGDYKLRVSSPGFWTLWREVTLKPRDRAVVVVAMLLSGDDEAEIQISGPVLMDGDFVIGSPIPIPGPPPPPPPPMPGEQG
ncbi:MAG: carboxypeptidase-like regulatory domain-containing protein [Terriglobia bacterium]